MIVGIDLGTTNSACSIWRDGKAELVPNSLGDFLTPSVVGLNDKNELLIGKAARDRETYHPESTTSAFKRLMGTDKKISLNTKTFSPEELSALVLRQLKEDVENHLGTSVSEAIITVPAYFNDRQRKATRFAGELAGLNVQRLINEPTAAALAHGIHEKDDEDPFLIFDLGGGTFDVSLVEIFDGVIEVHASAGDNWLGGEDFNDVMIKLARSRIDTWGAIKVDDEAAFHEVMRAAAERARRALTDEETVEFSIVWKDQEHRCSISRTQFEQEANPLIERLRGPLRQSIRDSGLQADQLGKIILVGGATRMPSVRRTVTKLFGRFPDTSLDPDHAVALGAAVQAGLKQKDSALDEIRLTDVCPFTLGVDTSHQDANGKIHEGFFAPIIERNTAIPASRVETFFPMSANQRKVRFNIYQGESRRVDGNVFLGRIEVPVPPGRDGEVSLDVRFTYDVSGLLEVDIHVPKTDLREQLVIQDGAENLSPKDLKNRRQSLEKLKVHPREESENAAIMARADRCFQSALGEERVYIGELISQFSAVLEKQDPKLIKQSRDEISERLTEIEGAPIL
ncbi:molecular chaperone HscC [Parasphingorhabdus litoris]|uniref:Molecular chaperone HscC n=1 Tax=Parasphingorhabdus litoris TaxID=394733 RepID=A0ABN1AL15_9SPHN|nr:molecular chaperone HscC [Parasphingorhabdus litoris]